jgi:hypothetical protein
MVEFALTLVFYALMATVAISVIVLGGYWLFDQWAAFVFASRDRVWAWRDGSDVPAAEPVPGDVPNGVPALGNAVEPGSGVLAGTMLARDITDDDMRVLLAALVARIERAAPTERAARERVLALLATLPTKHRRDGYWFGRDKLADCAGFRAAEAGQIIAAARTDATPPAPESPGLQVGDRLVIAP